MRFLHKQETLRLFFSLFWSYFLRLCLFPPTEYITNIGVLLLRIVEIVTKRQWCCILNVTDFDAFKWILPKFNKYRQAFSKIGQYSRRSTFSCWGFFLRHPSIQAGCIQANLLRGEIRVFHQHPSKNNRCRLSLLTFPFLCLQHLSSLPYILSALIIFSTPASDNQSLRQEPVNRSVFSTPGSLLHFYQMLILKKLQEDF